MMLKKTQSAKEKDPFYALLFHLGVQNGILGTLALISIATAIVDLIKG